MPDQDINKLAGTPPSQIGTILRDAHGKLFLGCRTDIMSFADPRNLGIAQVKVVTGKGAL